MFDNLNGHLIDSIKHYGEYSRNYENENKDL